jgi:Family of unknown function (DUF6525)
MTRSHGHNYREGDYFETREQMMAAYDAMPPELREVVANAPVQWATVPVLKRYRRNRCNVLAEVEYLHDAGRWILASFEFNRARALGVYRGNHPAVVDGLTEPLKWRQYQELVLESDLASHGERS